jgi:hypothetical protein
MKTANLLEGFCMGWPPGYFEIGGWITPRPERVKAIPRKNFATRFLPEGSTTDESSQPAFDYKSVRGLYERQKVADGFIEGRGLPETLDGGPEETVPRHGGLALTFRSPSTITHARVADPGLDRRANRGEAPSAFPSPAPQAVPRHEAAGLAEPA